ncbi:MAG TPA: type II toxin-antitoxin system VapC family toxin [Thermoanaerobaculia bacterium]|nr:type II toxin-antitoxin system VapC family toxin [Thermoanaerobaculia bacterium]
MILDSSVVVAIALREPGHEELVDKLRSADSLGIGAPTLTETGMVLSARLGVEPQALLDRFLRDFEVVPVAFGELHWREALEAFRRFGKGRHPAALNFGDCLSYATAKLAGHPLLFVGDDFPRTDIKSA